jgi:hypothetical protein
LAANVAQLHGGTTTTANTSQNFFIPPAATTTTEGDKEALKPPIDVLHDHPGSPEPELVDFTYYNIVIHAGLERPPRDIEEPRLLTMTNDTARALSETKTQASYDEYLHIK